MRPRHRIVELSILVLGLAATRLAVPQDDAPLPPRLDAAPGEPALARLPEDRRETLEEIVVIGEDQWRLPDLGSTWRRKAEEEELEGRLDVAFLPLYDAETTARNPDLFQINKEEQRIGFIELFRIRFGSRP